MSDEHLDDEAPPSIPDITESDVEASPAPAKPAAARPAPAPDFSDLDVEVDVDMEAPSEPPLDIEVPSEPDEQEEDDAEHVEPDVVESSPTPLQAPVPPPRRRERVKTNPATPVARASVPPPPEDSAPDVEPESFKPPPVPRIEVPPPAPAPEPAVPAEPVVSEAAIEAGAARPVSQPPRPVSQPPRPVSQPPRPVSQPPRPVSQPPPAIAKPVSQPPPAAPKPVSQPPPAAAMPVSRPARPESEPPTEPWHPPPDIDADAHAAAKPEPDHAATSYPPPPMHHEPPEPPAEEPASSLRPMRIISIASERPPKPVEAAAPPPKPVEAAPAPAEAAAPAALRTEVEAPSPSGEPLEEGDITFPSDETESDELTEDDITPTEARPSDPEIPVELETPAAPQKPPPPPPPRRDSGKVVKPVTPPSVVEAKEAQRTKQRKAWWEELFAEDFARANAKLKAAQVSREADFIEESLGVAKGGVMLDLACGNGHHAVELAKRGYGVVGYDLSLYQLAVAADVAQEAGQKLNLLQGDMREMAFEEMFDGIYCWNTSFGYFEEDKNVAVAQRAFRALRPGGMLLLDVANRDFVVANQPAQTWFEGDACVCMDDMSVDFITSRLRVKRSLILDDGRTLECVYSIRIYSLHELGKILHDAGFRVTEASGHPATPGVFFGASSPRILILAQRP